MRNRLVCLGLLAVTLGAQSPKKPNDLEVAEASLNKQIEQLGKGIEASNRLADGQNQIIVLLMKYVLASVERHPEDAPSAQALGKKIRRISNAVK